MLNSYLKVVYSGVSIVGIGAALYYSSRLSASKNDHKVRNVPATPLVAPRFYAECDIKGMEEIRLLLSRLPASRLLDQLATVEFVLRWPRLATFYYETKSRRHKEVMEQVKSSLLLEQTCFPQLFCFDTFSPQKKNTSLINNFVSDTVTWLRLFQSEHVSSVHYPVSFFYIHMQHFFPENLILSLGKCLTLLESENALPAPQFAPSNDDDRWREMQPIPVVPSAELSSVEWQQLDRGILDMAKVCLYAFKNVSCAWIVDMSPRNRNLATSPSFHKHWNKAVSYLYAHIAKCFEQQNSLWIAGVSDEWVDLDIFLETTRQHNVPCRLYYKDEWIYSEMSTFRKDSFPINSKLIQLLEAVQRNDIRLLIVQVPHLWLYQLPSRDITDQRVLWQCSDLDQLGAALVQRLGGNVLWFHVHHQKLSTLQSDYWRHWIFSSHHREAYQMERQLIKEQLTNLPL